MRVVHLNQDPGIAPGKKKGAAVHVAAMRKAFAALGADVVALDGPCDAAGRERMLVRLAEEHTRAPLDLLYERYALDADAGATFARAAGVPLVLEVNAPLLVEAAAHRGRANSAADVARERAVFDAAELLLCVSQGVAEYVLRHGLDSRRVLVRPNGVDRELFRPRADTLELRRVLGLADRFVIGFHGRLRPWHGFENVVAAAQRLLERGVPAHVLAIGEGEFAAALAPLGTRATHLAWLPHEDVARYVACFDALALGYRAEDACYFSPLKLLEALAAGAVGVVPAAGDLTSLLTAETDALFYPAGDVAALARELERIANDSDLRETLVRGGRELASRHGWDAIARDVCAFVQGARAR
ncbi:MAG: glycosyltransferase [Planctomycetes bacterium]|nr:glycosyltransferase [Planctomycetota bacterium]